MNDPIVDREFAERFMCAVHRPLNNGVYVPRLVGRGAPEAVDA